MTESVKAIRSSGNVFADLGLPSPDEELARADLAFDIHYEIEARGFGPAEVARLLDISETEARRLASAELSDGSVTCLQQYLAVLQSREPAAHGAADRV